MTNETKSTVCKWLYRSFEYYVPCGIALWQFLISSLINEEITVTQKVGVSGIFVLVIIAVIGVYFYGRHFKTSITKVTNEILECLDDTKKAELIAQKKSIESKQEIFRNACFLAPFILMWLLCSLIENGVVSLRGTLLSICLSMGAGMGFNGLGQYFKNK